MLRVLLADDEKIIRESISQMIDWNSIGYELIGTAQNGMEACDIIRDEYPDVVITDIRMPVMSGLDLIDYCVRLDADIRYVILSGFDDFKYAQQAMKYGVKHYLLKPTNKEQIIQALNEIHDEREKIIERYKVIGQTRLSGIRFYLQKYFLIELLDNEEKLPVSIAKYAPLINLTDTLGIVLHVAYLQPKSLGIFRERLFKTLRDTDIRLAFPIIYVTNNALIIPLSPDETAINVLCMSISHMSLFSQDVALELKVWHYTDTVSLFRVVVDKIRRYHQIQLLDTTGEYEEITNNITNPSQMSWLHRQICQASCTSELQKILHPVFASLASTDLARTIAISLLFHDPYQDSMEEIDKSVFLSKIFEKDVSSASIESILLSYLEKCKGIHPREDDRVRTLIPDMIQYMKSHLDSEQLSLKWLAEKQLYVSSGYLSKQFVQETGERFSVYLNRLRMEKAKDLMKSTPGISIQEIAQRCGFGDNPRYFSQVFRKYTGTTPSDFIAL